MLYTNLSDRKLKTGRYVSGFEAIHNNTIIRIIKYIECDK